MSGFTLGEYTQMILRQETFAARHAHERKVMIARACEFFSCREVAEALDMSPGSVWRIADDIRRGIRRDSKPGPKRVAS